MKVTYLSPENKIARVYVGELSDGSRIEFAESIQPPIPKEEKWVLIVSTLKGCPIKCKFCDAGLDFKGLLTKDEIIDQISEMIKNSYPDSLPKTKRLKIQFARMGDPAFNKNVLDVLKELPSLYGKIVMPSISTVAPCGADNFFEELIFIKDKYYGNGNFQLQFSIHSTDEEFRKKIITSKIWSFDKIAKYGERFYKKGDRKITLNFALGENFIVDTSILKKYFSIDRYLIKITPINPTKSSIKNKITSAVDCKNIYKNNLLLQDIQREGYTTILSIGELEENTIGSNCGMYIS